MLAECPQNRRAYSLNVLHALPRHLQHPRVPQHRTGAQQHVPGAARQPVQNSWVVKLQNPMQHVLETDDIAPNMQSTTRKSTSSIPYASHMASLCSNTETHARTPLPAKNTPPSPHPKVLQLTQAHSAQQGSPQQEPTCNHLIWIVCSTAHATSHC